MILKLPDSIVETPVILKDQFFDLRGLAAYASLSVSSLRNLIKSDRLPCFRLRGKLLVKRSEFDHWMSRYRLRSQRDVNSLVDEVMQEIGSPSRRSKSVTT